MLADRPRRLAGIAFTDVVPAQDEVPRMDVAVFAGFAASGPLNLPVPVEDADQFAAVFGTDAPLAWDERAGGTAFARLGPAVRMFFANGGRRCWVIRLAAATAESNEFPVPGVAAVVAGANETPGRASPLLLTARSPGRWSDSVRLATSVTSERIGITEWDPVANELVLAAARNGPLNTGDLLHLTWPGTDIEMYAGVAPESPSDRDDPTHSPDRVRLGASLWLERASGAGALEGAAAVGAESVAASIASPMISPPSESVSDDTISLTLTPAPLQPPDPGSVIVAHFGGRELLFVVREVVVGNAAEAEPASPYLASPSLASPDVTSPSHPSRLTLQGRGFWRIASAPPLSPGAQPVVRRLGLDLWARVADGTLLRVGDLSLAPGGGRHVSRLPDDATVHARDESFDRSKWQDVIAPRFPVAGRPAESLCIPFGVTSLPEHFLTARIGDRAPLERDGLHVFDATLFADAALASGYSTTLLADAEYLRFLAPDPRAVAGLHAALPIEEASLIAIPDAAQPGWEKVRFDEPIVPDAKVIEAPERCVKDDFADCGVTLGEGPVLSAPKSVGIDEGIALDWDAPRRGPFVVEEATSHDWRDAVVVFAGEGSSAILRGRRPGVYYYRVRGVDPLPTTWSNATPVRVEPGAGYRVRRREEYSDEVLVAVHWLMLRFCGARRDVMAVLSLPEHYDENAALAHVRRLRSRTERIAPFGALSYVPPLAGGEADALSFAALYHGWMFTRGERGDLRTVPPDGPACGVMARRATERGAWVAPANELLRGCIALERPAPRSRWLDLQEANVNLVRQDPRGFVVMSADTLSLDEEVRPINVRRLLILLRRLAIQRGSRYVFEPSDDSFRRMVQRGFEVTLGEMFERGAFAGNTAATAFQVVTDASVNTPRSMDAGRFIVELRVAPSRPMAFLTVRLVRSGDRLTVTGA
jgi:hypothetical protein